jgi:GDPmannose 4,6-dehydratase
VAVMRAALDSNADCRVLLASSAEIYAGVPRERYNEDSQISPVNPYGAAKAYAHQMARIMRSQGAFVATTVLFNHESPRRPLSFVTRKITHTAAAIAAGRESELVLGNLDAQRDWGWAPDYVDAMVLAARHDTAEEFVVATGTAHSVRDFALAALDAAGVDGGEDRIKTDPQFVRAADAPLLIGDAGKAREVLGWAPTKSFDQIVAAMVQHDLHTS